jgi:predicted dehydrogenase
MRRGQDLAGRPLRVGVIGAGLIAQVMHLHHLAELPGLFEVTAICDIVAENAQACAERYGIPTACTDWHDLIAEPVDAVLILTSGSHAPIAIAAAQAGRHIFAEKPMCFSAAEGEAMVAAADEAGVTLMVGYPKRYDPAFARFTEEAGDLTGARMLRVTTLESPIRPYVGHYPLLPPASPPADVLAGLLEDSRKRIAAAVPDADEHQRTIYHQVLLDTLVHEINTVRGMLGEPDRIDYADLGEQAVTVLLRFGALRVAIHWVDLPGIARYQMEFALFGLDRRVSLTFPSPFLRNEPATLTVEGGEPGAARSWRTEEVAGYESGFKRELEAFRSCVVTGTTPVTSGRDGLADVALCQAIIECCRLGQPVLLPTELAASPGS